MSIERIVYLNLSTINTKKFLDEVETALKNGGVDAAKDVCRNTRGPIASIFYQGLDRSEEGIEMVEKSVVSYGGVQMGLLEKGLSWLSLFIALAPMLGFLGTVIGMIQAFDKIVKDGQVSPTTVADSETGSTISVAFESATGSSCAVDKLMNPNVIAATSTKELSVFFMFSKISLIVF